MSGHSKWATIKRKKGKADAERGRVFTRLIKEITVAARHGGGDQSANPRLRSAVAAGKAANMPQSNIDRAIKKGTGELPGVVYEEVVYEGYGPGGVALLIESLTDNKNRTVSDVRHVLSKYGGNLGEAGCVAWMFEKKGVISLPATGIDEDELMMLVIDAGAEDLRSEDDMYEITVKPEQLEDVQQILEENNLSFESAEISQVPKNTVKLEGTQAERFLKLLDKLEDLDDIQNVYSNFDIDMREMENLNLSA
ncbi:YebC/PmpR family DNA-binding transcriptional regulator [candidate division KSB1 bacterium]|nr:YebC/PmpR family DNA-binding transcriptional regulator [candidate division KSB1 bacterium]